MKLSLLAMLLVGIGCCKSCPILYGDREGDYLTKGVYLQLGEELPPPEKRDCVHTIENYPEFGQLGRPMRIEFQTFRVGK